MVIGYQSPLKNILIATLYHIISSLKNKDEQLRSDWLARLKRYDFVPSTSTATKICSDHFFINDFNEADVLQPPAPGSKNRTI